MSRPRIIVFDEAAPIDYADYVAIEQRVLSYATTASGDIVVTTSTENSTMRFFNSILPLLAERQIFPVARDRMGPGKRNSDRALRQGFNTRVFLPNGARECERRVRQMAKRG